MNRKARAEKLEPTPDEEYDEVTDEASRVQRQIRDLQGFIDEAPQIAEERKQEMRVTLPPLEEEGVVSPALGLEAEEDIDGAEELHDRLGRRHLVAIKRERRKNFYIFLFSAAAVVGFLYWVSLVVQ